MGLNKERRYAQNVMVNLDGIVCDHTLRMSTSVSCFIKHKSYFIYNGSWKIACLRVSLYSVSSIVEITCYFCRSREKFLKTEIEEHVRQRHKGHWYIFCTHCHYTGLREENFAKHHRTRHRTLPKGN